MVEIIDDASFGTCRECGDPITLQNLTDEELLAKKRKVIANGGQCDLCEEDITAFDKRAGWALLQWLGPTAYRENVVSVIEPQNASYAVIALRDGRTGKVFRRGEVSRDLRDEIDHVMRREFPDLKKAENPWEKADGNP
jgi:hypothetical protein